MTTTPRLGRKALHLLAPLLVALGTAACSDPTAEWVDRPLIDNEHSIDILTENRRLEPPPSTAPNRFLTRWWPQLEGELLTLYPYPNPARIEIAHLDSRPRTLVLKLLLLDPPAGATIEVAAAGRDLGSYPIAETLEVTLPGDLPTGRISIDLTFPEGNQIAVTGAGIREALPAGEVLTEDTDIVQGGFSYADSVRKLTAPTEIRGSFVPPEDPRPGQSFELWVTPEGGEDTRVFSWSTTDGVSREELTFATPQVIRAGFARIRTVSRGQGSPGRWTDLRLRSPAQAPETVATRPEWTPRVVVVYVMDALRADYLEHLGGPEGTSPFIDRLAAEGVTFLEHLSVAPNTLPSTKALFTGHTFVAGGQTKLPRKGTTTLAELFREAGYRTGAFSGNEYISKGFGTDRGFEIVEEEALYTEEDFLASGFNDNATRVHRSALSWIDQRSPDEKIFIYAHTIHPHNPYEPPEPFRTRFVSGIESEIDGETRTLLDLKHQKTTATEEDERRLKALYAASIAYNDSEIERFVSALLERFSRDEILIVLTSDHGEELFDHGGVLHGYTLHDEMLRVPLVVWSPDHISPRRIEASTLNIDLNATLRALIDADDHSMLGRSLWPEILDQDRAGRESDVRFAAAPAVKGGVFMAQSARYKVIWAPRDTIKWGMGEGLGRSRDPEFVFDRQSDPEEKINLAGEDLMEAAWLHARLRAWVDRGLELQGPEEEATIDQAIRENLRALGYVD